MICNKKREDISLSSLFLIYNFIMSTYSYIYMFQMDVKSNIFNKEEVNLPLFFVSYNIYW